MRCHVWIPRLDHVWLWSNRTATRHVRAISSKEQHSWKPNCLSSAHRLCLAAGFTSSGEALRRYNYSDTQARVPSARLTTQRGRAPECSELPQSAAARCSQARGSGDCVLSTRYSSDHAVQHRDRDRETQLWSESMSLSPTPRYL